MKIFEVVDTDDSLEKFIVVLKNLIGRSASKKAPAKMNWNAMDQLAKSTGIELAADYETFKAMYDSSPALQALVKNFNADGIELNVPGAPSEEPQGDGTAEPGDSQSAVDQIAASAAPQQLAAQA